MFLQFAVARGRHKTSCFAVALSALALGVSVSVSAQAGDAPSWLPAASSSSSGAAVRAVKPRADWLDAQAQHDGVDTEHIFGFSMGSDIGKKGEIELEIENVGRFNKRFGSYTGVGVLSQVKFVLTDNFRVAPGVSFASTRVSGVPDMIDNRRTALAGASLEFRYKAARPRCDAVRPDAARRAGMEQVRRTDRLRRSDLWQRIRRADGQGTDPQHAVRHRQRLVLRRRVARPHQSMEPRFELSVNGALSTKVGADLIVGVEARYLRAYDGLGLDRFVGDAVYLGPTFSMHLAHNVGLSGTWSTQIAGKAVGDSRRLDLENFERHQAMLRLNYLF